MKNIPVKDPIIQDPEILGGEPVIKGTRIPASLIYELAVRRGYSPDLLVTEYPSLTKENVLKFLLLVDQSRYAQTQKA